MGRVITGWEGRLNVTVDIMVALLGGKPLSLIVAFWE